MKPLLVIVIAMLPACGGVPADFSTDGGSGSCSGTVAASFTPTSLNFGSVPIGSASDLVVEVTNSGTCPLVVASLVTATPGDFTVSTADLFVDCSDHARRGAIAPGAIAPGACAEFTVRWAPKTAGAASTSIVIKSNDPTNPIVRIPVTGG